jgi:hypothetical protein
MTPDRRQPSNFSPDSSNSADVLIDLSSSVITKLGNDESDFDDHHNPNSSSIPECIGGDNFSWNGIKITSSREHNPRSKKSQATKRSRTSCGEIRKKTRCKLANSASSATALAIRKRATQRGVQIQKLKKTNGNTKTVSGKIGLCRGYIPSATNLIAHAPGERYPKGRPYDPLFSAS